MCKGLEHCHERGVVHRDLKPGNFFVFEDYRIKIGDFGISKMICDKKQAAISRKIGTVNYMPPEILYGSATFTKKSADI